MCDGQPWEAGFWRLLKSHHALWCFLKNSLQEHDNIHVINSLILVVCTTKIGRVECWSGDS